MKWAGSKGTKYISFKNSTSDVRLDVLYINEMNNIEVKYEFIKNVDLSEEIEYQDKTAKFKEMILEVKMGEKNFLQELNKE